MAAAISLVFSPSSQSCCFFFSCSNRSTKPYYANPSHLFLRGYQIPHLLLHSRSSQSQVGRESLFFDHRNWSGGNIGDFNYGNGGGGGLDNEDYSDDDDDEDETEDRSLDLLVRFVQNVFRKVSKKTRKAVRSVLPVAISTKLIGFSVNGVIILAFLWVLKAFLEVVCTLGSIVFVSILLIRGIWSGISYSQENRNHKGNGFDDERGAWTGAQPTS